MFKFILSRFLVGILFLLFTFPSPLFTQPALAVVDPLSVSNNKFGIHIISPTVDEVKPASELVNSTGGDWGYITVIIEDSERDHQKWQDFFDLLRQKHLIPLVRLATSPDGGNWKVPYQGEETA